MPAARSAAVRASSCCRAEAARPSSGWLAWRWCALRRSSWSRTSPPRGNGKLNYLTRRRWFPMQKRCKPQRSWWALRWRRARPIPLVFVAGVPAGSTCARSLMRRSRLHPVYAALWTAIVQGDRRQAPRRIRAPPALVAGAPRIRKPAVQGHACLTSLKLADNRSSKSQRLLAVTAKGRKWLAQPAADRLRDLLFEMKRPHKDRFANYDDPLSDMSRFDQLRRNRNRATLIIRHGLILSGVRRRTGAASR